jgi:hypothetical protein
MREDPHDQDRLFNRGEDLQFAATLIMLNSKMLVPFGKGPDYLIKLSPSMLNTQGDPRRNEHGQIVRPLRKRRGTIGSSAKRISGIAAGAAKRAKDISSSTGDEIDKGRFNGQ